MLFYMQLQLMAFKLQNGCSVWIQKTLNIVHKSLEPLFRHFNSAFETFFEARKLWFSWRLITQKKPIRTRISTFKSKLEWHECKLILTDFFRKETNIPVVLVFHEVLVIPANPVRPETNRNKMHTVIYSSYQHKHKFKSMYVRDCMCNCLWKL